MSGINDQHNPDRETNETAADILNEAGSIGDEQCPAYVDKTDKREWDGASTKAKGDRIIPQRIREFLNGL
ncbi:MAG TPA: hypothetical protein V6C86_18750 [Oculatellaceae cyanobacterium]